MTFFAVITVARAAVAFAVASTFTEAAAAFITGIAGANGVATDAVIIF